MKSLAFLSALLSLVLTVESTYSNQCDTVFCRILDDSLKEIADLKSVVDGGSCVPDLGQRADNICNVALERFSQDAAISPNDADEKSNEAIYDKKIEDLEKFLDAPLHVLYLKQLSIIREKALKAFKSGLLSSGSGEAGTSEYEAMVTADELFRREAEASTRQTPDWDYARELQSLKAALSEIASRSKKVQEARLLAAKQNQQAMQYLQMQQQQLQAIQQQVQGSSSPWNIAMAYRIPDSNFNINGNYQGGRASIAVSCVPDEAMSLLGPNGFTQGVTPGNLGLSFNINL